MAAPLEGIRVIDWTILHQGPSGAMLLAELGADVIHVEQAGRGDPMRGFSSLFGVPLLLAGNRQALFEDLNKNKRSLTLDLTKPKGRELMYRLVATADVLVTNLRPQAVRKLEMDYEHLVKVNPRLIFGQATAFGEEGPERDSPGLELTGYARSGGMLGSVEFGRSPVYLTAGAGDRIGGIFLLVGVLTSLWVREKTGFGQHFSTSQLGGMVNLQAAAVISAILTGEDMRPTARTEAANPLYNWYCCQDGRWIVVASVIDTQAHWPRFCSAMEHPELEHDACFATNELRAENCRALIAILDETFARRPSNEWEDRFREAGVLCSRVNTIPDLLSDPQVLANRYIVPFQHPVLGAMQQVAIPITFSRSTTVLRSEAPECGQHNEQILVDELGLSWEEVAQLSEEGVI